MALRPVQLLALSMVIAGTACDRPSPVRAFVASSRTELVGGPGAVGETEDIVLENDQVRLVISRAGSSAGPGLFGGSIVDADLRRPTIEFSNAHGLDQFSEVFPMANLIVPGFADEGEPHPGLGDLKVTVLEDGSDGARAVVRISAKGDALIEALASLGYIGVSADLSFETDMILEPGKRYVRLRTRLNVDSLRTPEETDAPEQDVEMDSLQGVQPLFGALLGDLLLDPDERQLAPGYMAGDMLLFGPKVKIFATGEGYGVAPRFQERFEAGEDLINDPYTTPYLAATGEHVSYAYFSADGALSVPIFTSSFTGAFTHLYQCALDDTECSARLEEGRLVYERFLALGEGDVASALDSFYEVRGEPVGTLRGHVLEGVTGRPLSGADVFVMADPGGSPATFEEAARLNREETGGSGIISQMRTDVAADARPLGAFSGHLPAGEYLLVARAAGRSPTRPLPFSIAAGETRELSIAVDPPGHIDVQVFNEVGAPIPGKLTLIGPGECAGPTQGTGITGRSTLQQLALGDPEIPDGIAATFYLRPGPNQVSIAAGEYEAVVSRGVEYSLHRQCVTVRPSRTEIVRALVAHVVDTTGWISGDFHIHGVRSFDANLSDLKRVMASVGEGMDLISSSDHDWVTDFRPMVEQLGMGDLLATMIGLETTTVETGHYIGFPLRFDQLARQNGAIDWARLDECVQDPAASGCTWGPDGIHLPLVPDEIFSALRSLGSLGPDQTVVLVPHPRDGFFGYFDQFGMNSFDLTSSPSGIATENPILTPGFFSGDLDAIEVLNGKRFELIRTPSLAEISEFNAGIEALKAGGASEAEIAALHEEVARRVLTRTPVENEAMRFTSGVPETGGNCTTAADCRPDEKCGVRGRCVELDCTPEEAADPTLADRPCRHHQGVIDDWFRLLNHGVRFTGMGNSDTHDLYRVEVGIPRNWLASPTDAPNEIEARDVADAIHGARVTTGFGPFVELWVDDQPIGSTVTASAGGVDVRVRVQTPEWFGVDRLEVYRNGELWQERALEADVTEVVDIDETFHDEPEGDVWYVAIAVGAAGSLAPVYTSQSRLTLGFSQVLDAALRGIDSSALQSFLAPSPRAPELTPVVPYGVTNPVWVDVDGGGFQPLDPTPDWAHGASNELPLESSRIVNAFREPVLSDEEVRKRRHDILRRYLEQAMEM